MKIKEFLEKHFSEELKINSDIDEVVISLLKKHANIKDEIKFSATILFNRGLGPEYYSIPEIVAETPEDAIACATSLAKSKFGKTIIEVKVRVI